MDELPSKSGHDLDVRAADFDALLKMLHTLPHSSTIMAGVKFLLVTVSIFGIAFAFVASLRAAASLEVSLTDNRNIVTVQTNEAIIPAAEQLDTLANKLRELSSKFEKIDSKASKADLEAVKKELFAHSKTVQNISSDLVDAAGELRKAGGQEIHADEAKPMPIIEQPRGSIMDGLAPDPTRNPRWYGNHHPNLVEVYYQKNAASIGASLRSNLTQRGAFIPPPGKHDPTRVSRDNFIYYYHEQDKRLADNVFTAIEDFFRDKFRDKEVTITIRPPEIPVKFKKTDVQIGQIAVYLGDIPDIHP